MPFPHRSTIAATFVVMAAATGCTGAVHGQDFVSSLFGGFSRGPTTSMPVLSFANPQDEVRPAAPLRRGGSSRVAFCVRGCDGRYFPVPASDDESASTICNNFCPASPTKVVYGSSIDSAYTSSGQSYADLPNAFRYRNELVSGCTCNGKDTVGLAAIRIEDDHTLRKGDVVAGANGLVVASGRTDGRHVASFTPAPASIRNKFGRVPVLASE